MGGPGKIGWDMSAHVRRDGGRRKIACLDHAALHPPIPACGARRSLWPWLARWIFYSSSSRSRNLRANVSCALPRKPAGQRVLLAQKEVDARSAEVQHLNETLEERVRVRTAELERVNRELEAFSYSVSHDLRAPLRTIDGFSLALQEDYAASIDDAGHDYIDRVRGGVQRMGQLIDALLQLSRITRSEIIREDFSMSELANSVANDLKEQNRDRDLSFTIEPGQNVNADPGLTRIALENLIGNAVKFTSKTPHATVAFGWDPEQNAWYVRDNGAGFDMIYAGKLFGAFNRLHGDKDFKGSGIGLATVARVIHGHHGRIWADSAVNQGSTSGSRWNRPAISQFDDAPRKNRSYLRPIVLAGNQLLHPQTLGDGWPVLRRLPAARRQRPLSRA